MWGPVLALVVVRGGRGVRLLLDDAGQTLASIQEGTPSTAPAPQYPWIAGTSFTRLLAADHTHLLWATRAEMVCERIADPGRVAWRLPLPAPCEGRDEAWAFGQANIVATDGVLFLRDGTRLWAYSDR